MTGVQTCALPIFRVGRRHRDARRRPARTARLPLPQTGRGVERRWSPDTGSKNPDIIQGYVDAAMDTQKDGTNSYAIEVLLEDCIPTRDFEVGDIIGVELRNPNLPEVDTNLRARLLGWVADPDPVSGQILKIKPILQGVTNGY